MQKLDRQNLQELKDQKLYKLEKQNLQKLQAQKVEMQNLQKLQKHYDKVSIQLIQHLNQKQTLEMRLGPNSKEARRARTRTLIQLGGLVEKAGLLDQLGIETGQDLQRDADTVDGAATLMGSLMFLKEFFQGDEAGTHKMLWKLRGKEALHDPRQLQPVPVSKDLNAI